MKMGELDILYERASQPVLSEGRSEARADLVEIVPELRKEIIDAGHRYADLQAVCDDQDKQITDLKTTLLREINRSIGNYEESYAVLRELVESVELAMRRSE